MLSQPKKALVAEDNVALARVIGFTLTQQGFDVTVTRDGQEAWAAAREQAFDLIVSDLQMPRMDGLQLCGRLRETTTHAATPIVLLTAKGMELDADRVREEFRLSALLIKPFSPTQLGQIAAGLVALPA